MFFTLEKIANDKATVLFLTSKFDLVGYLFTGMTMYFKFNILGTFKLLRLKIACGCKKTRLSYN